MRKVVHNLISFVIPCYRSEDTIEKVIKEIAETVGERPEYDYEAICVNDGSPDHVSEVLHRLAAGNPKVKVVDLARNRGKHTALLAGHHFVSGEYVCEIDDDLQSPVPELWRLVEPVERDECDIASANYFQKKESRFKRFGSWVNREVTSIMLEKPRTLSLDNFRVMKRFVSDEVIKYKNPYPYMEGLLLTVTRRITIVMMEQRSRGDDKSSGFTFGRSLALWTNGLTSFSVKPLRIATVSGGIFSLIGFVWAVVVIVRKLMFGAEILAGYSSLMAITLIMTGMIMAMIGMLGEYVGRIYMSINSMDQYTVRDTFNVDGEAGKRTGGMEDIHEDSSKNDKNAETTLK